ncbi:hypothetical protein, partial [Vibrio harveyi]|uniref:hypothetical protein n=2 Tax=Vibrio harveyi TaxID=669 RepID=UPI0018C2ACFF
MNHSKYPLKLAEINELLTTSNKYRQDKKHELNVSKHIQASYIAEILWNLELETPRLDREYVYKLQTGEVDWITKDGKSISLKEDFDFSLLEELGIVLFEHNWIRINARLPRVEQYYDFDKSVLPMLRFLENLSQILSGYHDASELKPVTFSIDKEKFESIVPPLFEFDQYNIDIDEAGECYLIKISEDGWGNGSLISDYFWVRFVKSRDTQAAIEHFYDLRVAYSAITRFPNEENFCTDDEKVINDLYKKCINDSSLLKLSFEQYRNYLWSQQSFDLSLVSTQRTIQINIGGGERKPDDVIKTPLAIEEVVRNYSGYPVEYFESDLDLITWNRRHEPMHYYSDLGYMSLRAIIRKDIFVHYSDVIGRDEVETLFEKAKDNFVLRSFLLYDLSLTTDNSFNLYLLSNPDFFIVGFENLLCRTKEKYRSNNN